jgi:hypothetical protein
MRGADANECANTKIKKDTHTDGPKQVTAEQIGNGTSYHG